MKVKLKQPVLVRLEIDRMETRQEWSEGPARLTRERTTEGSEWSVTLSLPASAAVVIDAEQVFTRTEIPLSGGALGIAEPLDWILTGVDGDRLPCRRGDFETLYEPVA